MWFTSKRKKQEEAAAAAAAAAAAEKKREHDEQIAKIAARIQAQLDRGEKPGVYDVEFVQVNVYRPADVTAPMPEVGEYVQLVPDPYNEYDSDAIAVKHHGQVVGYLNKGRLRDSIHKAFDEDYAPVTEVTRADDKLQVYIGFDRE